MGRLSDTDVGLMLDLYFGQHVVTVPATHYVGLSTTQPTNAGAGITEPVGAGYAPVAVANDATTWPVAASRAKSNGVAVTFPQPTGAWGECGWFVVRADTAAGRMVGWGALAEARIITDTSQPPSFPVGALILSAPS